MSTGEALYLAMVIAAMLAFCGTLAWVTYGGKSEPQKRRPARPATRDINRPAPTDARRRSRVDRRGLWGRGGERGIPHPSGRASRSASIAMRTSSERLRAAILSMTRAR